MNKNQKSKNNMYDKMLVFFVIPAFVEIWASFGVLVDDIALFVTRKKKLDEYIIQQQLTIGGITEEKDKDMLKAEKFTIKLAKKAKVWAKKSGDSVLKALFSITKKQLNEMAGAESVAKMTEVAAALLTKATPLLAYNITDGNITDLNDFIVAANAKLGTPASAKATTKAGTEGVESQMKEVDDVLADIDDVLIAEYEEDEENMVKEYKNNRTIDNIGHFATKLIASIINAATGIALENIKMTIIEIGRTADSTIEGIAGIERFKAGTYHIKFEGEGYVTQLIIVKTKRGKAVEVAVKMVAVDV